MDTIKLTIDNVEVEVEKGKTVLEAAQSTGIYIPALCAHPDLPPAPGLKADTVVYLGGQPYQSSDPDEELQGCRLCMVEVEGIEELLTSCTLPATEGMIVHTNTPRVQELRREHLKTILAKHPHVCLTCSQREGCIPFESCPNSIPILERCCSKLGYCELGSIAEYIGIKQDIPRYTYRDLPVKKDEPLFTQDYNLCIGCTRCVRVCRDVCGIGALGFINRDGEIITGPIAPSLKESGCKFCGACIEVCPTGALLDVDIKRAEREAALVPCTHACPAGIDVPRYVRLIAEGKFAEAVAVVREKVPFPLVLGHVCFHPCEEKCRRGEVTDPISIMALKRFAAEHDDGLWRQGIRLAPPTGKRVAIIGSGPSGLTTAYYLNKLGHSVTVFESLSKPGGMMLVGIPRFQLPEEVLAQEIDDIVNLGVDLRLNSPVTSLDSLFEDGYQAVFIAIGLQQGRKLPIPGTELDGVLIGTSFLHDVNMGREVKLGSKVLVLGGGGVACDVARVARRLGVAQVHMACLESRETMPAHPWETKAAEEEGIVIHPSRAFSKILGDNGRVAGVECLSVKWMEFDKEGRLHLENIEGSEHTLEADTVIFAVGQALDPTLVGNGSGINLSKRATIIVDSEMMQTTRAGVFAGGDVTTGPASVIEAIAAGRKAAASIDKYLGGSGEIDDVLAETAKASPWLGRDEGFYDRHRVLVPCLPAEQRIGTFSEVELGFDEGMAVGEAVRCLRCDLRLQISPVLLPPAEWLELTTENIDAAPETDGVYRLLDDQKEVIYIGSGPNIREGLQELQKSGEEWLEKARYLHYEESLMYTMRESELMQQFLQEHGRLPEGNDELF
ncbi:MAG: BzdV protein [Dehalococcoidia bacterium]|nr:MAG: BzdV protein [Dehalococcoidia bacterium]